MEKNNRYRKHKKRKARLSLAGKIVALLLVAIIVLSSIALCNSFSGQGELIINEAMPKNAGFYADENGDFAPWIELYNIGGTTAKLENFTLSDNRGNTSKLRGASLKKGGYLVVFLDGKDYTDSATNTLHSGIKYESGVTQITISGGSQDYSLNLSGALSNVTLGRVEEKGNDHGYFMWFETPTPKSMNTGRYAATASEVVPKVESAVAITSYTAANSATLPSPDGSCHPYCTVKNITSNSVSLADYALSNDGNDLMKWMFEAEQTLEPGASMRVWLSGLNYTVGDEPHAGFKLANEEGELILSVKGSLAQAVTVEALPEGIYSLIGETVQYSRINKGTLCDTVVDACRVDSIGVYISEVSSVKGNGAKEQYDWIELYNPTDSDIDLSGYMLSDSANRKKGTRLADAKIKANSYLLVYCSGGVPTSAKKNSIYAEFKISATGETIYLFDTDGIAHDLIDLPKLRAGVSCGRSNDLSGETVLFDKPTPNSANSSVYCDGYAREAVLDNDGGYVISGTRISASSEDGATLRYTTDGSVPTSKSPVFHGVTLTNNTVIRIKAFKDGKISSDTVTATYIIGAASDRSLPVVCLASDPEGLFSEDSGILAYGKKYDSAFPYTGANFWQDWEREANFEYYVNGEKIIDVLSGIKVFGQYSRAYDQKSLAVYFRGDYGTDEVRYPFFANSSHETLTSLVLRAGGQDQGYTRIRDAFCSQVMKGHTALAFQEWQPIAVYINGEYWGYFDLREKINEDFLERYYGVDGDNIDLIKGNKNAKAGTNEAWLALRDYVKSHDLTKQTYYDYVCSQVDIDNFIDYLITEIFFCNGDTGNIKFYRERTETGKWRWIMYDFDISLRNEALWDNYNMFERLFNPAGHGTNNAFSSALQCALLKNKDFRARFIDRFAELLNTVFMPEHMLDVLEPMIDSIDGEMRTHCERWGKPKTYEDWRTEVKNLYRIVNGRRDHVKKQLIAYFSLSASETNRLFPND